MLMKLALISYIMMTWYSFRFPKKNHLSLILLLENRHDLTARFYKSIKKKDYYMM